MLCYVWMMLNGLCMCYIMLYMLYYIYYILLYTIIYILLYCITIVTIVYHITILIHINTAPGSCDEGPAGCSWPSPAEWRVSPSWSKNIVQICPNVGKPILNRGKSLEHNWNRLKISENNWDYSPFSKSFQNIINIIGTTILRSIDVGNLKFKPLQLWKFQESPNQFLVVALRRIFAKIRSLESWKWCETTENWLTCRYSALGFSRSFSQILWLTGLLIFLDAGIDLDDIKIS